MAGHPRPSLLRESGWLLAGDKPSVSCDLSTHTPLATRRHPLWHPATLGPWRQGRTRWGQGSVGTAVGAGQEGRRVLEGPARSVGHGPPRGDEVRCHRKPEPGFGYCFGLWILQSLPSPQVPWVALSSLQSGAACPAHSTGGTPGKRGAAAPGSHPLAAARVAACGL